MNKKTLFRAAACLQIALQLLLVVSPVFQVAAETRILPDTQTSSLHPKSPFAVDNQQSGDASVPYSSQLSEGAQALASGNAADAATSLAVGEASGALQNWLGQFGTARIQMNVDRHGNWGHSSGDLLVPLYDNQTSLMFVQGGIRKPSDRLTGNLGYGVRTFWQNGWMYGGNVFFDDDFTGKNRRVGIGAEAWTDYLRLSANTYVGTTQWHTSRDFDGSWQEKPASGYDIRTEGWLPAYPQLGAKLVWEQYYGSQVALFDKNHLQRNPHAVTAGVEYTPIPLITLGVEQKQGNSQHDTQATLGLHWTLGHSWSWQTDPANVDAIRSLAGSRYELVNRNNEIVMQYRKNPDDVVTHLALTVQTDNSPADGVSHNVLQVLATNRNGQPVRNAALSWGLLSDGSTKLMPVSAVTNNNGLATVLLSSTKAQTVPVSVQSGSASATQNTHFAAMTVSHIALAMTQDNALADGSGEDTVVATLTDSNNKAVAGQKVSWTVPEGVTVKGGDAESDSDGKVTVTLVSTVAGDLKVSGTSGDQSADTTAHFTAVDDDVFGTPTLSLFFTPTPNPGVINKGNAANEKYIVTYDGIQTGDVVTINFTFDDTSYEELTYTYTVTDSDVAKGKATLGAYQDLLNGGNGIKSKSEISATVKRDGIEKTSNTINITFETAA